MIDYSGLMKHMPEILAVAAIGGLLIGVSYLIHSTFERIQRKNNNELLLVCCCTIEIFFLLLFMCAFDIPLIVRFGNKKGSHIKTASMPVIGIAGYS